MTIEEIVAQIRINWNAEAERKAKLAHDMCRERMKAANYNFPMSNTKLH